MQDLKTGHLIGASPRAQFYGQLLGSALSVLVTTSAYSLYQRAYPIPGPNFPAPTAYVWLSLARLLRTYTNRSCMRLDNRRFIGDKELPRKSGEFMIVFALLAALNAGLKIRATIRGQWWAKWTPSGIAFAVGFLNTPSFSLARLVGGIVEYMYNRRKGQQKGGSGIRLIVIASGFVLGEGTFSIVSLVLKTSGVGIASCWGCAEGSCPGC
jgi:uncharacterized oligopeptide transporter (OPT) family protein